ncbi:hypothetical protein [Micromonospora sp. URMC 103]|uniref:hypothetical protein n=1 Tax=Micromonospora sp. URMC 103 TaxID=3423406 RepID=UPI003F1C186D
MSREAAGTLLLLASSGWLIARGDIGIGGLAMAYGYMARPAKVPCDWMSRQREAGEATERVRRIGTLLDEPEEVAASQRPGTSTVQLPDLVIACTRRSMFVIVRPLYTWNPGSTPTRFRPGPSLIRPREQPLAWPITVR